jgi:hypothetical protein
MDERELTRAKQLGSVDGEADRSPRPPETIESWNPGLDNDHLTLRQVLDTLPGNRQDEMPFMVRLFENPKSPIAFKGAINLFRHDCVHVTLGRGILPQDEAFVVGFTMGTTKSISKLKSWLFEQIGRHLYTPPYNFTESEGRAYRHGLQTGEEASIRDIHLVPFELMTHLPLETIRSITRMGKDALCAAYRREQELLPGSYASERLPVRYHKAPTGDAPPSATNQGNA